MAGMNYFLNKTWGQFCTLTPLPLLKKRQVEIKLYKNYKKKKLYISVFNAPIFMEIE
jgi:hypothetical protein